jgi:hypothetical protein
VLAAPSNFDGFCRADGQAVQGKPQEDLVERVSSDQTLGEW